MLPTAPRTVLERWVQRFEVDQTPACPRSQSKVPKSPPKSVSGALQADQQPGVQRSRRWTRTGSVSQSSDPTINLNNSKFSWTTRQLWATKGAGFNPEARIFWWNKRPPSIDPWNDHSMEEGCFPMLLIEWFSISFFVCNQLCSFHLILLAN